jgi:uncharacterized protein involved in exopolysaccharide biosynthesis
MNSVTQSSLRDLALVFFKRKWSVTAVFATAMLSALVYIFVIRDDVYRTQAKVLVRLGYEQSPSATAVGERSMIVSQRYEDVNTEVELLQNHDVIAELVDKYRLDQPSPPKVPDGFVARARYHLKRVARGIKESFAEVLIKVGLRERLTPREKAIFALKQGLVVVPQKDSHVLVASLAFPTREYAGELLNALLDIYQQHRLKAFEDSSAVNFFLAQVQDSRTKLAAAEAALKKFESEGNIYNIEEQKKTLIGQLAAAEGAARDAALRLQEAEEQLAQVSGELNFGNAPALAGDFDQNSVLGALSKDLAQLKQERAKLRLIEPENSPRLANNGLQYRTVLEIMSSNLQAICTERESVIASRRRDLEDYRNQLAVLHARQARWQELVREVKVLDENYYFNEKKLQEAQARAALERSNVGNVVVVERASDPLAPSGLRKTTLLGVVLALSAFAAVAWVSLLEFFDHRVYSADHLQRQIGKPVLATIPIFKQAAMRRAIAPAVVN